MTHRVVFSPAAEGRSARIYDYISDRGGLDRALRYVQRIIDYCRGFADFPERGTKRDDLLPGLRIVGFERRVSIAFHVSGHEVTFDRLFYGGRDILFLRATRQSSPCRQLRPSTIYEMPRPPALEGAIALKIFRLLGTHPLR